MRLRMILTVFSSLMASFALAQDSLPQSGQCQHEDAVLGGSLTTTIAWAGERATLSSHTGTITGQVIGLRPHDTEFKLSILYDDPITGPSEMTIFGYEDDGTLRHRRAIIGYHILPDGTRVVSHVSGFEDINCSVLE